MVSGSQVSEASELNQDSSGEDLYDRAMRYKDIYPGLLAHHIDNSITTFITSTR
jgi:hypothetical protein